MQNQQELNALLYFWNSTCSVCEPFYEKLDVLITDYFPKLQIKKINVAENPKLRTKYDVFSSPLIVLILDDREYFRSGGNVSTKELEEKIQRLYQLKFDK